jgi:hypothetical protein
MNDDELRDLLASVQAGDVSPEEAADQLRVRRSDEETKPIDKEPPVVEHDQDVRRVRIRAVADRAFVQGDPTVRSVRVEGHHRMREEDGTLLIESDFGDLDDLADDIGLGFGGFRIRTGRRGFGPGFKLHRLAERGTLRVTVNPSIPVDVECDAGNVEVRDVPGPLSVRVNAGNAKVIGINGPLIAVVNAGNLRARGRLRGESSLDCSVGKIDLELDDDTPIRVIKTVSLGSVDVDPDISGSGPDVLEVTCHLGSVRVRSSSFTVAG